MFLRHEICSKGGNRHRYWSVIENKRVAGGRVVQRHGLHLGEINDSQEFGVAPFDRGVGRGGGSAAAENHRCRRQPPVVPTCGVWSQWSQPLSLTNPAQSAKFG